ncbi:MAG TPA: addiction module protein [Flavobacteriaceae bacterium]|nr:addiction module protein [Flavobacteriaceae bacterium]
MENTKLKEKLQVQFSEIIEDEKNLLYLERIFEDINDKEYISKVPESHYKIVDERRRKHLAGETESLSWEVVKGKIIKKHGF